MVTVKGCNMYYSDSLITSIDAHKILALKLEHALTGVKDEVLKQAQLLDDGATRLSYQLSCFTENYQDVCLRLRKEDSRFLTGIVQLIKHRDVIYKMLYIYIKSLFAVRIWYGSQGRPNNKTKKEPDKKYFFHSQHLRLIK